MRETSTEIRDRPLRVLSAYLLGRLDFDDWLDLQRRLVYEISGDRANGVLLLCEHGHGITIGREGSAAHVHLEAEELRTLGWPVRWVNRGGGCLLSAPGQVALYPIVALDQLGLNLQAYLDQLHDWLRSALVDLEVPAEVRPSRSGVWVGERRIAHVGVAVRDWVSSFGCAVNVQPQLHWFRQVSCDGHDRPMTSIERERRGPARPAAIRQRLLAGFAERFGFDRVSVFHHHPAMRRRSLAHAAVADPC